MKRRDQLIELRRLTEKQLSDKIIESQKAIVVQRQEKLLGKVKDTAKVKDLQRDIARMKTILDEKITARLSTKQDG